MKGLFKTVYKHLYCLDKFPNRHQQGFQKHLGCLTTSFCLLETIYNNIELNSKVYVAFLDSRKAFDTVWRKALMYKLYKLGIKGRAWSVINECHLNTESTFIVNQCKSEYFNVVEGVRQGGVLSGLLYLAFINDLLYGLEESNKTGICNVTCCAPSLLLMTLRALLCHRIVFSVCWTFVQITLTLGDLNLMARNHAF